MYHTSHCVSPQLSLTPFLAGINISADGSTPDRSSIVVQHKIETYLGWDPKKEYYAAKRDFMDVEATASAANEALTAAMGPNPGADSCVCGGRRGAVFAERGPPKDE